MELARERTLGGRPAIEDPSIRRGLAELEGYVRSHQYSGYLQMTKDLKGENPGIIQLMNKLNSTNMGHMISKLAMEILGDDGVVAPSPRGMGMVDRDSAGWITQYMCLGRCRDRRRYGQCPAQRDRRARSRTASRRRGQSQQVDRSK